MDSSKPLELEQLYDWINDYPKYFYHVIISSNEMSQEGKEEEEKK